MSPFFLSTVFRSWAAAAWPRRCTTAARSGRLIDIGMVEHHDIHGRYPGKARNPEFLYELQRQPGLEPFHNDAFACEHVAGQPQGQAIGMR